MSKVRLEGESRIMAKMIYVINFLSMHCKNNILLTVMEFRKIIATKLCLTLYIKKVLLHFDGKAESCLQSLYLFLSFRFTFIVVCHDGCVSCLFVEQS